MAQVRPRGGKWHKEVEGGRGASQGAGRQAGRYGASGVQVAQLQENVTDFISINNLAEVTARQVSSDKGAEVEHGQLQNVPLLP